MLIFSSEGYLAFLSLRYMLKLGFCDLIFLWKILKKNILKTNEMLWRFSFYNDDIEEEKKKKEFENFWIYYIWNILDLMKYYVI